MYMPCVCVCVCLFVGGGGGVSACHIMQGDMLCEVQGNMACAVQGDIPCAIQGICCVLIYYAMQGRIRTLHGVLRCGCILCKPCGK